jgi:hypothetical protein
MKRDNKYGTSHTVRKHNEYMIPKFKVIVNGNNTPKKVCDTDKKCWSAYSETLAYNHPEYRKPSPRSFIKIEKIREQMSFQDLETR